MVRCSTAWRRQVETTESWRATVDALPPLRVCTNLAISGTGSRALYSLLSHHSRLAHHDETIAADRALELATCVFSTIADPARRIEVALRFLQRHRLALLRRRDPLALALLHWTGSNLTVVIQALRSHTSRLARLYQSSVRGLPEWDRQSGNGTKGAAHASLFFVPQTQYLRRRVGQCLAPRSTTASATPPTQPQTTLRLVCTEQLHDDWAHILSLSGDPFPWAAWSAEPLSCSWRLLLDLQRRLKGQVPAVAPCGAKRWRSGAESGLGERNRAVKPDGDGTAVRDAFGARLSERDANFVRTVLYPHDWALYQHVCTAPQGGPMHNRRSTMVAVLVPTAFLGIVVGLYAFMCVYVLRCVALFVQTCVVG